MLLPLVAAMAAARPAIEAPQPATWGHPGWAAIPVADGLHPVVFDYGARYQQLLAAGMGGPRSNVVFGPVVAEADLHWRLVAATGQGLPLDAATATAWRDTALAGTTVALQGLLDETFRRAPQLRVAQVAVDAVISPSVEVRRQSGKLRLDHPTAARRAMLESQESDEAVVRGGQPAPSVRWGFDWTLKDEEAPADAPLFAWKAYFTTTETFLTRFRADVAVADLEWSLSVRERFYPQVYAIASARSVTVDRKGREPLAVPDPGRLSGGVMWTPPWVRGWSVRVERITTIPDGAVTWMATLRGENHTPIPAKVAPPLGEVQPGGLAMPHVHPMRPNRIVGW